MQDHVRDNFQEWLQYVYKMLFWTALEELDQFLDCIFFQQGLLHFPVVVVMS